MLHKINRSQDAAEGGSNEPINLLNQLDSIDLTKVDRSFPCLATGKHDFYLRKFEAKINSKKTGHNLHITLELAADAKTDDGKTLRKGFKFSDMVSLVQTEQFNPAEKLADIQLAALGAQQKGFKFSELAGKMVTCAVTVSDDPEFGKRNRFRYVKRATTETIGSM